MRFPYRGAGIGLVHDKCLLIGKRSDHPFYGKWAVPGGGREKTDKSEVDTAKRELFEETGIELDKLETRALGSLTIRLPFFRWTSFYFEVKTKDFQLKADEFSDLEWVALDMVKKKHLRPFMKSEVRYLSKKLN